MAMQLRVVRLEIEGMGCEACQTHVKALLDRSAAVVASTVNFSQGSAQVWVQEGWDCVRRVLSWRVVGIGVMLAVCKLFEASVLPTSWTSLLVSSDASCGVG